MMAAPVKNKDDREIFTGFRVVRAIEEKKKGGRHGPGIDAISEADSSEGKMVIRSFHTGGFSLLLLAGLVMCAAPVLAQTVAPNSPQADVLSSPPSGSNATPTASPSAPSSPDSYSNATAAATPSVPSAAAEGLNRHPGTLANTPPVQAPLPQPVSPASASNPVYTEPVGGGILPSMDRPSARTGTRVPLQPGQAAQQQQNTMPVDPPPLPQDNRLDSAIQNEAERAYYDNKRRRYQNTFDHAYEGLVPLGPNEIRDTMDRYERTQRAAVPPAAGQPSGQVRIKTLSLEPGSEPPTINVGSGYVTTITILDATGEPWPIIDLGIGGNFEVSKTGGGAAGSHVVRIMPLTRYGYGNLSVILQDLSTPIIFKLASGGPSVDYRFDGRVPRMGPNAKVSLIDRKNALRAGSAEIMTFLDNAPPPSAQRVRINGADSRTMAWLIDKRMFVRTPLTMISPSWDASVASADGTTVYELEETPVLLMSDNGVLVRARVARKEEE
jgi:intracellular multiplication protein IcmK